MTISLSLTEYADVAITHKFSLARNEIQYPPSYLVFSMALQMVSLSLSRRITVSCPKTRRGRVLPKSNPIQRYISSATDIMLLINQRCINSTFPLEQRNDNYNFLTSRYSMRGALPSCHQESFLLFVFRKNCALRGIQCKELNVIEREIACVRAAYVHTAHELPILEMKATSERLSNFILKPSDSFLWKTTINDAYCL